MTSQCTLWPLEMARPVSAEVTSHGCLQLLPHRRGLGARGGSAELEARNQPCSLVAGNKTQRHSSVGKWAAPNSAVKVTARAQNTQCNHGAVGPL